MKKTTFDIMNFDLIDIDELEDEMSAIEIHRSMRKHFLGLEQHHYPSLHHWAHATIYNRASQIPECLVKNYSLNSNKLKLSNPVPIPCFIVPGKTGGNHARINKKDGTIIVLDRDILIRSAIFTYYRLSNRPYDQFINAVISLHIGLYPRQPLPFQEVVYYHLRKEIFPIINVLIDFVTLHEMGHSYLEEINSDRSGFLVKELRGELKELYQKGGDEFRHIVFPGSIDSFLMPPEHHELSDFLLLPEGESQLVEEISCDLFALHSRLLMDAEGQFRDLVFDLLPVRLLILAYHLLAHDIAEKNINQDQELNEITHSMDYDSPNDKLTHPRGFIRWQAYFLHSLNQITNFRNNLSELFNLVTEKGAQAFNTSNLVAITAGIQLMHQAPLDAWEKCDIESFDLLDALYGGYWTLNEYNPNMKGLVMRTYGQGLINTIGDGESTSSTGDLIKHKSDWKPLHNSKRFESTTTSLRVLNGTAQAIHSSNNNQNHPFDDFLSENPDIMKKVIEYYKID